MRLVALARCWTVNTHNIMLLDIMPSYELAIQ
jgi:hypothetical protein